MLKQCSNWVDFMAFANGTQHVIYWKKFDSLYKNYWPWVRFVAVVKITQGFRFPGNNVDGYAYSLIWTVVRGELYQGQGTRHCVSRCECNYKLISILCVRDLLLGTWICFQHMQQISWNIRWRMFHKQTDYHHVKCQDNQIWEKKVWWSGIDLDPESRTEAVLSSGPFCPDVFMSGHYS